MHILTYLKFCKPLAVK